MENDVLTFEPRIEVSISFLGSKENFDQIVKLMKEKKELSPKDLRVIFKNMESAYITSTSA